jgi:predicted short-subunit dehydrogenase-like oxidoreductase (DUF2520 family)
MRIGFIGAGRVGFTLGKYMKEHGAEVTGYYSRTSEHAEEAARFTDTEVYDDPDKLIKDSDYIYLTVSDNAIEPLFKELDAKYDLTGKTFCHTSGAMSSKAFADSKHEVYGYSVHPNFAVSDKLTSYLNFQNAFITIEGSHQHLGEIVEFYRNIGLHVGVISAESKPKYHAASVFASNFVCGIYGTAIRLLTECGFSDESAHMALKGLFLGNATGVAERGPVAQLTGPAERCDTKTINKHLEVLSDQDAELYKLLTSETLTLAKEKNVDRDYSELERLLTAE